MRFKHLAIVTFDLEKIYNFYLDYFGFKLIKKYFRSDLDLDIRLIKKGELVLELLSVKKEKSKSKQPGFKNFSFLSKVGYNHLCFESKNFEKDFRKLKQNKDVKILIAPTRGTTGRQFFIEDPEGNIIEIYQTDL